MYGALRALFLNTNYHELSMNYFMNFFVNAYSFRQFQIPVYYFAPSRSSKWVRLNVLLGCPNKMGAAGSGSLM